MRKFNWGWGITIGISLFIGYILLMVFKAFSVSSDLYAEDYYKQEVNFQETINAKQIGFPYKEKIKISTINDAIKVTFSKDFNAFGKATISFYRPNNASFDKTIDIDFKTTGLSHSFSGKEFLRGNYTIKISWLKDEITHLVQKDIFY
jgi:hypothetical protein